MPSPRSLTFIDAFFQHPHPICSLRSVASFSIGPDCDTPRFSVQHHVVIATSSLAHLNPVSPSLFLVKQPGSPPVRASGGFLLVQILHSQPVWPVRPACSTTTSSLLRSAHSPLSDHAPHQPSPVPLLTQASTQCWLSPACHMDPLLSVQLSSCSQILFSPGDPASHGLL